ncbi:MAG: 30S ribosomal protein S6 [Dehalococcoidia bacterium]|nr:30S ribosomal protein S6 [Dehalococcoidia bacterium]MDW8120055.1 30S ribosomal protein S6 [Chloroflexota bacterium]
MRGILELVHTALGPAGGIEAEQSVPIRDYELVLVISPEVDDARTQAVVDRVHRLITQKGGTLVQHESWGRKRLAYPIRNYKEGAYFFTRFQADAQTSRAIEQTLRVTEEVLRHLLVKVE